MYFWEMYYFTFSSLFSSSDICIVVSTIFCRLDVSSVRGFPCRQRICWRARVAVSTSGRDTGPEFGTCPKSGGPSYTAACKRKSAIAGDPDAFGRKHRALRSGGRDNKEYFRHKGQVGYMTSLYVSISRKCGCRAPVPGKLENFEV